MKKYILYIIAVFSIGLILSCRSISIPPEEPVPVPIASTLTILDDPEAQHIIFLAFAKAHPTKIRDVEFIDNDWTMLVNGVRFYFAQGRFLPEELRDQWERFSPYDFYVYPWLGTAAERRAAFNHPVRSVGSSFLFDALYFSPTEDDSWDQQMLYSFLGVKLVVHSYITPFLNSVSDQVRIAAQTDPSINEWIAELRTSPPSFSWN